MCTIKNRFQKLDDIYDVSTITMEDVNQMKKEEYPKELGLHENKEVYLKKGKYGLYLEWNKKNYKLMNDCDENLSLRDAIGCLVEKKNNDIHNYGDYVVKNGPYGPYILYKSKFYKITGNYVAEDLSKADCKKIVENYSKSNSSTKSNKN